MDHNKHFHSFTQGIHHAFAHVVITLLAVGIAFSLPVVAKYILFYWWPKVEDNSQLLMITEISFATVPVLLFNISKIAWDGRRSMQMNKIASLVYAREGRGWMSRWKERDMPRRLPARVTCASCRSPATPSARKTATCGRRWNWLMKFA